MASGRPCVLTACVLPMGFVNSVSIAQHVHRNIVSWSQQTTGGLGGESEMRKDRVSSRARTQYRVYLDNFDLVERFDPPTAQALGGQVAEAVPPPTGAVLQSRHPPSPQESRGACRGGGDPRCDR